MIVAPLVASLVQLAISRQREYLADATAQNSSMAHLWIANPLKKGGLDRLFSTHPPIAERIERLHKMSGSF
jgi:heat shock protein HtpX